MLLIGHSHYLRRLMQATASISIEKAIVHQVGNQARGERIILSENELTLNDELVRQMLAKYFLQHFDEHEQYHFTHHSSLGLNEVYTYVKHIFNQPENFVAESKHIAQLLYQVSTHTRIKQGELYIVHLKGLQLNNEETEAVVLVKSEHKDTFLKLLKHGKNLEVVAEEGINMQKPDKACLIFKTAEADGYRVCVIDNTNKQQDAQYWVKEFLQIEPVADNYHHTSEVLSMCRQFVTQELPEHFEITKGQQIDMMHRSLDYFKEKEQFNMEEFTTEVIPYPDMAEQFEQFKDNYEKSRNVQFDDEFDIHLSAVKKQSKVFKSVLKLDKNFHVYIHGRRDLIERGYDEMTGKHFYKIYFEEES
jgi:hypothetical protein